MKLQQKTIEKIRQLINEETEYRSGPKLVAFFNELGFNDSYGQVFPSRWVYTENKFKSGFRVHFLCGSTLEGILLGIASNNPQKYNTATASLKDKAGKVLPFYKWKLGNFIDVAKEAGFVGEDIKKFSHVLRDFRNYIHPYEQATKAFSPDEHTAKLCWQVLKIAIFPITINV